MSIKSSWLMVLFTSTLSLLTFCLLLCWLLTGVLKPPTVRAALSISPCSSVFLPHVFCCCIVGSIHIAFVQFLSCVWLFEPQGLQQARLPCPPLSPRVCSNLCPLNQWFRLVLCCLLLVLLCLSQHQVLLQWIGSLHQLAQVLELQL